MPETITLEVQRYRPEDEAEPVFERFDVPFRADWMPHPDQMQAVRWALSQVEEYEVKFR